MSSKVVPGTSKYDLVKTPEAEATEVDDDDFSWGVSVKEEKAAKIAAKSVSLSNIQKTHVNSYRAQRNAMKEKIVNEVLDAALPDVSNQ